MVVYYPVMPLKVALEKATMPFTAPLLYQVLAALSAQQLALVSLSPDFQELAIC